LKEGPVFLQVWLSSSRGHLHYSFLNRACFWSWRNILIKLS